MHREDLRYRARRLLDGDCRIVDLDRLFLGLRGHSGAQACFREIGDFVAHRDTREKGLVTQIGRDVFTSLDVWSLKMRGRDWSWDDIARAAYANLRLASDEQLLNGCGCRRPAAKQRLKRALAKARQGEAVSTGESRTLNYLGDSFIWRPAFNAKQLAHEFDQVLHRNGISQRDDGPFPNHVQNFLTLYALTIMHGSAILLENGTKARLFAGFANRERHLEVKVEIVFHELPKPIMAPICLFLTDLYPEEHCSPTLLEQMNPVLCTHWDFPIDIGANGRLDRAG